VSQSSWDLAKLFWNEINDETMTVMENEKKNVCKFLVGVPEEIIPFRSHRRRLDLNETVGW
jgi:hypothetical protein